MSTTGHFADLSGEFGQEDGFVSGAGADLQDAVVGAGVELVEHHGDDSAVEGTAPVDAELGGPAPITAGVPT